MMKKTIVIFSLVALVAACSNNNDSTGTANNKTEQARPEDPEAQKGLDLVAKSDCFQCHKVAEQYQGPAYEAVAERYKNADAATVDTLAQRIIKGSKGHWGTIPMTAHASLSMEDARLMVKYVLSLKK